MSVSSDPTPDPVGAPESGPVTGAERDGDVQMVTPVVVDLGKVRRKHVKALKRGEGKLVDEVVDVLDDVVEEVGDELAGSTLVPVVLIYERKPKSRRRTIELPF